MNGLPASAPRAGGAKSRVGSSLGGVERARVARDSKAVVRNNAMLARSC